MIKLKFIVLALGLIGAWQSGTAYPALHLREIVKGTAVYPDSNDPTRFYYLPPNLQLQFQTDGSPDVKLVQMRYTGTRTQADQGTTRLKSLLRIGVGIPTLPSGLQEAILKELSASSGQKNTLEPLPLYRIEASLILAALGEETRVVKAGYLDGSDQPANDGIWKRRVFTVRLDPATSQLIDQSLRKGAAPISVAFAYHAVGSIPPAGTLATQIFLDSELNDTADLPDFLADTEDTINTKGSISRIVSASTLSLTLDAKQHPNLVQQVDINDRLPPGFALLDIYCFDFRNDLSPEVYAKRIDIKAAGVGSDQVQTSVTFSESEPDLYAQSVRFQHAVRADQPYHFQVLTIQQDGSVQASSW
ncbi:MAG: hypothetical protein AAF840_18240, partial [Bacteroidota bacterium]